MELKYIETDDYKKDIENLYLKAFPQDERFPFWILDKCSKENNSYLLAILDNDKFVGMCYLVNCKNAYYLMYLAVESKIRNKNYGSRILADLKEKYKTIFLSVEEPIDDISIRRKNFYLGNGFYDTDKYYKDNGVIYNVLCTNNEYEITDDNMQMRYINMTNNLKLFNIIKNIFNTDFVNLYNKGVDHNE